MTPMTSALKAATKIRQVFVKYDFNPQKNSDGYTINASDEQFIQNGGGMCRDFVAQQTKMFKRMRPYVEFDSILFLPTDKSGNWLSKLTMHAFTVIYAADGSVYLPESILDPLKGIWWFPTLNDCICAVRTALGYTNTLHFEVYTYIGDDDNLVGRTRKQTVDYIRVNGVRLENCGKDLVYEGLRVGG